MLPSNFLGLGVGGGGGSGRNNRNFNYNPMPTQGDNYFQGVLFRAKPDCYYKDGTPLKGDKIVLPKSAGNLFYQIDAYDQPMKFEIFSDRFNQQIVCGLRDTVAPDETIILPFWMFKTLSLREDQFVMVKLIPRGIHRGGFAQFKPHKKEFALQPNPINILNMELGGGNYTCLTEGQTIQVEFAKTKFLIDVIELQFDKKRVQTICTVETDLKIEFEPAYDDIPEPQIPHIIENDQNVTKDPQNPIFQGEGRPIFGDPKKRKPSDNIVSQPIYDPRQHKLEKGLRKPQLITFAGRGIVLGGPNARQQQQFPVPKSKPVENEPQLTMTSGIKISSQIGDGKPPSSSSSNSGSMMNDKRPPVNKK